MAKSLTPSEWKDAFLKSDGKSRFDHCVKDAKNQGAPVSVGIRVPGSQSIQYMDIYPDGSVRNAITASACPWRY